jgi:hypothetical protein
MKYPYAGTEVSPEKTQVQIITLLKSYGIEAQLTTPRPNNQDQTTIDFIHRVKVAGIEKQIMFHFKTPVLNKTVKQYNPKTYRTETMTVNDEPAAWRLLYWYIKLKLRAIQWNLATYEQEFMSRIAAQLEDGRMVTLGEGLEKMLANGTLEHLALAQKG